MKAMASSVKALRGRDAAKECKCPKSSNKAFGHSGMTYSNSHNIRICTRFAYSLFRLSIYMICEVLVDSKDR